MGRNKKFDNLTPEQMEKWENRTANLQKFRLYTLTDIEPIVGATHRTLLEHIKTGRLKAVKIGGVWQVSEENVRSFCNGETIPQPSHYSTRFDALYHLWENETEDEETQEWREDLSPFEEKTVEAWDDSFSNGISRITSDILKATEKRRKPLVIFGMTPAEREEFREWLRECCGADYDAMSEDELKQAALRWYEEQAPQEEP